MAAMGGENRDIPYLRFALQPEGQRTVDGGPLGRLGGKLRHAISEARAASARLTVRGAVVIFLIGAY